MKAILVDDEKDYLVILQALLARHAPHVEVIAACTDPRDAVVKIRTLKPHVVFLDIQMPGLTGFEMLSEVGRKDFDVIFTTSHDGFAMKALKLGALDYLLKPIDAEELKEAVKKITLRQADSASEQLEMLMSYFRPEKQRTRRVALTASDHLVFVQTNEIVYCESDSNYTTFFLVNGEKIVISKTLKDVEEILEGDDFFRIHASYLVNMKHVQKFTRGDGGFVVMSNNKQLSVSRKKKDEFFEMFSRL
jgi:two-component system LytT family response regulator